MSKEKDNFFRDWLWKVNGVEEIDPKVKEFIQKIKDKKGVYEYENGRWQGKLFFLCAISADPENVKQEVYLVMKGANCNQLDIISARELLDWQNNKGKVPLIQELTNNTRYFPGHWTNGPFIGAIDDEIGSIIIPAKKGVKLNLIIRDLYRRKGTYP